MVEGLRTMAIKNGAWRSRRDSVRGRGARMLDHLVWKTPSPIAGMRYGFGASPRFCLSKFNFKFPGAKIGAIGSW